MRRYIWFLPFTLSTALILIVLASTAYSQISIEEPGGKLVPLTPQQQASLKAFAIQYMANYNAWVLAPWAGDDRPYASIRNQIEGQISRGEDPQKILDDWKKPWTKNPHNTQLAFGRAYAAYEVIRASDLKPKSDIYGSEPPELYDAQNIYSDFGYHYKLRSDQVNMPHTYNTMRLAFFEIAVSLNDRAGVILGDKLLKESPNDATVQYYLIRQLIYSKDMNDFQRASKMATIFEQADSSSPQSWRIKELIAEATASHQHSLPLFDLAIADANQAADAYPTGSIGEANTRAWAEGLLRVRARHASEGWQ